MDFLDKQKKWQTHITVEKGQYLHGGDIIAEVPETRAIVHKCMVPPEVEGTVTSVVADGEYTIDDTLITLELPDGSTKELTMTQHWPIRVPRPTHHRFPASVPLITGQRIVDTMFPIAKGGTAAIPGGFGTGKTMMQHQIAKWADADIIIYIGCGERGNEMTQVLEEFGELIDPRTGNPLMDRTTLIANTSNMPWQPVRQVSIPDSHWLNITAIWAMTLLLWRTPHQDGPRRSANSPDDWKKCLPRKVSPLIWHPDCPHSTSVQV